MADLTNEGIEAGNAFTAAARRSEAYNALSKAYGPAIADNPENALNAATASANIPLAPQAAQTTLATNQASLQGKQLENTQTAQTQQQLAGYRAAQVLKSYANPDGSIPQDAYDKIIRPNAGLFGIDPAHVDQFGQLLTAPGGASHLDSISQALIGPTKITGATTYAQTVGPDGKPSTVAVSRDQYGNIHETPLSGVTTTQQQNAATNASKLPILQQNANTNAAKLPILQQNANTNTYRANTGSNNSLYGNPGGTLAQRDTVAPAPGAETNPAVPVLTGKPLATRTSAAQQIAATDVNIQNANTIANSMKSQITPYTTGAGAIMSKLPGSVAANLHANAETLRAQAAQAVLAGMKNSQGSTGVGRILQAEYKNFTNMFGNLEQDQSAKQYAFHLDLLQQSLNRMQNIQHQSFKTQYGVDHNTVLGIQPDGGAAPPALPKGWTYNGVVK
jgi:hypothetical protein